MEKIRKGMTPFLSNKEYIPDGEPHVFGDRIYLFGSHDRFDGTGYCQDPYVSWPASVDRLTDWVYEGVILEKGQDPFQKALDKAYEISYIKHKLGATNPERGGLRLWRREITVRCYRRNNI